MSAEQRFLHDFGQFLTEAIAKDIDAARQRAQLQWKQVKPAANAKARHKAFEQLLINAMERAHRDKGLLTPLTEVSLSDLGGLSFDLEANSVDRTLSALTDALADQGWRAHELNRVLAYQYMAARISVLDEGFIYQSDGGRDCKRMHWLHCLLVANGSWEHARWMGRYLMNFHRGGETRFPDEDSNLQIQGVLRLIARITEEDAWPDVDTIEDDLGPYKILMSNVAVPEKFSQALMQVMDFKMARYNSCKDVDTSGRSSKWSGILAAEYWALVPAEVLAIRALARKHLGVDVDLRIDHPWINQPLALALPAVDVEWEDDTLSQVKKLVRQRFGDQGFSLGLLPRLSSHEVRAQIDAWYARG